MTKTITSFFTSSGTPSTGLSATIRIRKLSDNSLVVTNAVMTEVGDGWYKYDFTTYDEEEDYAIRCDGSATLSATDRYSFAGNESYLEDIWDAQTADHQVVGSLALALQSAGGGGVLLGSGHTLNKDEAEAIAQMVWETILKNGKSAEDVLLSRSAFNALKDKVLIKGKVEVGGLNKVVEDIKKAVKTEVVIDLEPINEAMKKLVASISALEKKNTDVTVTVEVPQSIRDEIVAVIKTVNNSLVDIQDSVDSQGKEVLDTVLSSLDTINENVNLESVATLAEMVEKLRDTLVAIISLPQEKAQVDPDQREFLKQQLIGLKNIEFALLTNKKK